MEPTFVRLLKNGDPANGMQPSKLIGAESFTTDSKNESIHDFFESEDQKVSAGVWAMSASRL